MFHAELRRFPHLTHGFNLEREELDSRILRPWASGAQFDWGEKRWDPGRAKLTIYEGRELRPEEIGLGRGWANVTRTGKDVTAELLSAARTPPAVGELKRELVTRCAQAPLALRDVVALATERHPQSRASERLALAEQAVWELLHERRLTIIDDDDGRPIDTGEWQSVLLTWQTWTEDSGRLKLADAAGPS